MSVLRPAAMANRKTANSALNVAVNDWKKNAKTLSGNCCSYWLKRTHKKCVRKQERFCHLAANVHGKYGGGGGDPEAKECVQLSHLIFLVNHACHCSWLWWMAFCGMFDERIIVTFTLMVDINPLALIQSVTVAAETHTMLWIWNIKAETPQLWWNDKFDLTR